MGQGIGRIVILINLFTLTSCSIINPQLPPVKFAVDARVEPNFSAAVQRANEVNQGFYDRMIAMEQFDFWSGLGLFGAGVAGLSVGVFHGSKHDLLLAGALGAGLLGLRTFLPFAARKTIYENGQGAISCTIIALSFETETKSSDTVATGDTGGSGRAEPPGSPEFSSGVLRNRSDPTSSVEDLLARSKKLEKNLEEIQEQFKATRRSTLRSGSPEMATAMVVPGTELETRLSMLARTHDETYVALKDVDSSMAEQNRARRLDNTVAAIKLAVNKQLNANGVNPQGAVQAANTQISSFIGSVVDTVKNARQKADELYAKAKETKDKAAETKAVAEAVGGGTASGGTGGSNKSSNVGTSVDEVTAVAEKEKEFAEDIDARMKQILQSLQIPEGCFFGFLASSGSL
jgi:hypothetical protein